MRLPKALLNKKKIIEIAKNYKVKELYLFGSVLREDFTADSDIDIMVVFEENTGFSLFDFYDLKDEFESCLQRKVDLVEKAGITSPYRQKEIFTTARRIYVAQ